MNCNVCGGDDWLVVIAVHHSYLVMEGIVLPEDNNVGKAVIVLTCLAQNNTERCGHEVERTLDLDEYEDVLEKLEKGMLPDGWK